MRKYISICAILLAFAGCTQKSNYEKLEDGVVVHLAPSNIKAAKQIKLQVVSEKIIHVTSTAADTFVTGKSLIILPDLKSTAKWKIEEKENELVLSTSQIKANVSLTSGEVVFTDTTGHIILQEKKGGGKTITPVTIDNEKMFSLRQVFESPDKEAFYGLGQHQEGVMNYKGKDVSLFQYNTKVSVPFLVSNKNYGILWDNYSLSKFGDPRDYKSISLLKLYSKEEKEGGLSAHYVSKMDASKEYLNRLDTVINYEFLTDLKKYPKEFPLNDGKVIWEGFVESAFTGEHKFLTYYAGYTKVWFNHSVVVDHWRQAWNPGSVPFQFEMEKGKKYPIKIEWIPDGGESYISLKWLYTPKEEQNQLSLFSEAGDQIDYYFIAGKNLDEVISGYRTLTGKAEIFPKWAMGFWQSRERYKTQKEILDIASEFRKRKIPIDNIVLDWSYWEQEKWGSQEFDLTRFPDAAAMIKELHEKDHLHFMISAWPKFYEGIDNYKLFDSQGWLYKQNIKNRQRDWIGQGYVSTFYDPFNTEARNAFWELLHKNLHSKGVDAWWMDATEPDILSNASIEERKKLMNPTALGSSTKYFNAYQLMNEKGIYEGLKKADPDKRVFILTRSAFAGSQRYAAATWSGDIAANWQDFKTQISAGLNFSLSGIPYWTTDIGGFSVERKFENAKGEELEEWRERMTRWFQFGAFSPLFRAHGQYPFREMFNVAPDNHPAYQTMLYYDKLRYRLMPYIYSITGKVYHDDYTLMRALVMDFPNDKNVLGIGTEYLFGPSILVSPVTQYKEKSWKVYLPAGTDWYDLHTGKFHQGGKILEENTSIDKMPLYVKAGSVIPTGPEIQYTDEKPADPLTLYVYTGANGSFDLYEDQGLNNDYQKNQYSIIPLSYKEETKTLTMGERKGSFPGMLEKRNIEIVWISKEKPAGLNLKAKGDQVVSYEGKEITVKHQ
jgi:alpha-D-xyloside xylohydrolase